MPSLEPNSQMIVNAIFWPSNEDTPNEYVRGHSSLINTFRPIVVVPGFLRKYSLREQQASSSRERAREGVVSRIRNSTMKLLVGDVAASSTSLSLHLNRYFRQASQEPHPCSVRIKPRQRFCTAFYIFIYFLQYRSVYYCFYGIWVMFMCACPLFEVVISLEVIVPNRVNIDSTGFESTLSHLLIFHCADRRSARTSRGYISMSLVRLPTAPPPGGCVFSMAITNSCAAGREMPRTSNPILHISVRL